MTQRQVRHAPGELPACTGGCNASPRHFADLRAARAGGGEFLECARCDRRTARHATLEAAALEWHRISGTTPPAPPSAGQQARTTVRAIR